MTVISNLMQRTCGTRLDSIALIDRSIRTPSHPRSRPDTNLDFASPARITGQLGTFGPFAQRRRLHRRRSLRHYVLAERGRTRRIHHICSPATKGKRRRQRSSSSISPRRRVVSKQRQRRIHDKLPKRCGKVYRLALGYNAVRCQWQKWWSIWALVER